MVDIFLFTNSACNLDYLGTFHGTYLISYLSNQLLTIHLPIFSSWSFNSETLTCNDSAMGTSIDLKVTKHMSRRFIRTCCHNFPNKDGLILYMLSGNLRLWSSVHIGINYLAALLMYPPYCLEGCLSLLLDVRALYEIDVGLRRCHLPSLSQNLGKHTWRP